MRNWLDGGAIPDEQEIQDDLTGIEYGYGRDETTLTLEKEGAHEAARACLARQWGCSGLHLRRVRGAANASGLSKLNPLSILHPVEKASPTSTRTCTSSRDST
jgi:hypothetical protein